MRWYSTRLQSARSRGTDVLLADTAGRLHSQSHLMEELKKVKRVIQRVDPTAPHEVLLVLDANRGRTHSPKRCNSTKPSCHRFSC